jgi:catechol 2,3-dioxygenase-like lactoylglutathione lyase family enzyme
MAVQLNHTIVKSHNKQASAEFLARVLGLQPPDRFAHFVIVKLSNGVSLDFDNADEVHPQHYAFLVGDEDFDEIFERVKQAAITYFADPEFRRPGEINSRDAGRGFYFRDPNGHHLEVLTHPYGSAVS